MPGFIYIVCFDSGLIKVGKTRNPKDRVGTHRREGAHHGNLALAAWVSDSLDDYDRAETELLAIAGQTAATIHGREWFEGVDFDLILSAAVRLFGGEAVNYWEQAPPRDIVPTTGSWRDAFGHLHLRGLEGNGTAAAHLAWIILLSERVPGMETVHASNSHLAERCGLTMRELLRGLSCLRACGAVTSDMASVGRTITLATARGTIIAPDATDIASLREQCSLLRSRPLPLVVAAVGAYAMIASQAGEAIDHEWRPLPGRRADLRRFVGMPKNYSWTGKIRTLEQAGLIQMHGSELWLAPRHLWAADAAGRI